ncbi:hypothetical protein WJX72_006203 [[Myrmecia] bisecta]|uniref:Uncharacterized protein n=1 Tax=[Myrmecia] bisecta TaxID=41462 RepID=A0AAW1Q182_9CHLO
MAVDLGIPMQDVAAGANAWYNVSESVRHAIEALASHVTSQSSTIRRLEDALHSKATARSVTTLQQRLEDFEADLSLVRGCAAGASKATVRLDSRLTTVCASVGCADEPTGSREVHDYERVSRAASKKAAGSNAVSVTERLTELERQVEEAHGAAAQARHECQALQSRVDVANAELRAELAAAVATCTAAGRAGSAHLASACIKQTEALLDGHVAVVNGDIAGLREQLDSLKRQLDRNSKAATRGAMVQDQLQADLECIQADVTRATTEFVTEETLTKRLASVSQAVEREVALRVDAHAQQVSGQLKQVQASLEGKLAQEVGRLRSALREVQATAESARKQSLGPCSACNQALAASDRLQYAEQQLECLHSNVALANQGNQGPLAHRVAALEEQVEAASQQLAGFPDMTEQIKRLRCLEKQVQQNTEGVASVSDATYQRVEEHAAAIKRLSDAISCNMEDRPTDAAVRRLVKEGIASCEESAEALVRPLRDSLRRLKERIACETSDCKVCHRLEANMSEMSEAAGRLERRLHALEAGAAQQGVAALARQAAERLAHMLEMGDEAASPIFASLDTRLRAAAANTGARMDVLETAQREMHALLRATREELSQVDSCVRAAVSMEDLERAMTAAAEDWQRSLRERDGQDSRRWQDLLHKFKTCFDDTRRDLEEKTQLQADIRTEVQKELAAKLYRLAPQLTDISELQAGQAASHKELAQLRLVLNQKADKHSIEGALQLLEQAISKKVSIRAMDDALSRKLDVRTYLAGIDAGGLTALTGLKHGTPSPSKPATSVPSATRASFLKA